MLRLNSLEYVQTFRQPNHMWKRKLRGFRILIPKKSITSAARIDRGLIKMRLSIKILINKIIEYKFT